MSKFDGNNATDMRPALSEEHLEFKLGIRAKGYVRQWLDLQDFVMLSSYVDHFTEEFNTVFMKALQEGRINSRQETRIVATDVIMRAKLRSDKSPVCIAIEASYTIDASDINRAKESADALLIVTGLPTIPVAAGYHISDQTRRYAEEWGVEVRLVSS